MPALRRVSFIREIQAPLGQEAAGFKYANDNNRLLTHYIRYGYKLDIAYGNQPN